MTRLPSVGALAVLALVTAALETAALARDPADLVGTVVVPAAIWFQGVWALMAWRAPRRGILAVGLVANVGLLAASLVRLLALGDRPIPPSSALVVVFQGLLVTGIAALLVRQPGATGHGGRTAAVITGTLALLLAGGSLAVAGPAIPPPGSLSPIVGTASRPTAATATPGSSAGVPTGAAAPPTAAGTPAPPGAVAVGSGPLRATAPATALPSDLGGTDGPSPNPAAAAPAATTVATAAPPGNPSAGPSATATRVPVPTPGPTAGSGAPTAATGPAAASATPTARAAAVPASLHPTTAPTARPAPVPTSPRTPAPAPSRTPAPVPSYAPTPAATPPATTAPGVPGTIVFGTGYDPGTLAITGRTSTVHAGEAVAWRADLSEPAGSTTLTFTITQPNPHGPEFPHWQEDFGVPDPSYVVIVNRADLSVYVHGEPGTFIMRIRRGPAGPILAEGRFSVIP